MIKLSQPQTEKIKQVFGKNLHGNTHLGWLDIEELHNAGGSVYIDDPGSCRVMIAFQPIAENICWLHTFETKFSPENIELLSFLKSVLPAGRTSVYVISSHRWFDRILERSGFSKCDEIFEYECEKLSIRQYAASHVPFTPPANEWKEIYDHCEFAFPKVWRLGRYEFQKAVTDASFRNAIYIGQKPAGYLLAQLDNENCHILRIVVSDDHQRQGVGSALLTDLIKECERRNIRHYSVNTNINNRNAVDYYTRMGFRNIPGSYPVYHRFINVR